jgi:GTP-binding protein
MNRLFHSYGPTKGDVQGRRNGVLISNAAGTATQYSLWYLEDRGKLMIGAGVTVYEGMIIGQHAKDNDLIVNVVENKKLTNVRAAGKDESTALSPPMQMTLEKSLAYIEDDELVEVTPQSIRIRKRWLDPNLRKRMERSKSAEVA